jgi:hypothetical protein
MRWHIAEDRNVGPIAPLDAGPNSILITRQSLAARSVKVPNALSPVRCRLIAVSGK